MPCMILWLPWMLLYDASYITILHIHALASCISSRYARWTTWRTWGWNRIQRRCMVDFSQRWKDPWSTCLNRGCSPSQCRLTSTDLVLDSRQAPEHFRSPMFWKWLLWVSLFVDTSSDRNWMQTLAAYISILCPVNVPWILFRSRSESELSLA